MSESRPAKSGGSAKPTRSRQGCRECRRLHRKCDERRPHCDNCLSVGKTCSYKKNLSWGGRPFGKSSFGKTLGAGVVLVNSTGSSTSTAQAGTSPFVYSSTQPAPSTRSSECDTIARSGSPPLRIDSSTPNPLELTPDWLSWMSTEHRSLIDHFARNLTPCFSIHPVQHASFCSNFLPLALDSTHGTCLLAAILTSALVHRDSLTSPESDIRFAHLYQTCIYHLRQKLASENAEVDDVYVATALILCLTEILAGGRKLGTWRMHLNGAAASLDSFAPNSTKSTSSTRLFLWRWCRSLRANALSSAQQALPSPLLGTDLDDIKMLESEYIDLFDGFSTDLLPIFREINDLVQEANAIRDLEQRHVEAPQSIRVLRSMLGSRCSRLISKIKAMSKQPVNKLDPLIPLSQQNAHCIDFVLLNQVYHHTALLQLYQRVLDKPQADPEVQDVVRSGINCLRQLRLQDYASPGVATLHPIFTIGCSVSTIEERLFVMDWLENMRKRYSMGNVQSSKSFLLELWQRNDALEATGSHMRWDKLMLEKNWDLSLY
ncbi:fungal-specific transcription factor domain-containing protein [Thelonectria olida]|uniref:Fungal-specific transcription factor domain-containing protein n=1 Tax=Thelonectria olida TaxID=1576542 RepID=A0A9P8VTG2_9HYPO|nr:fungal-specific transcription factor domain-containing protein [Thelonectria olida]